MSSKNIFVKGAREHNLKNIDLEIPRDQLVVFTGLSGSGKSSLINEILYKHLASELNGAKCRAGEHDKITGLQYLDKVIDINQSPIGRTPRSNPATYTGVWDKIRTLFAKTPEAQVRGYGPGRFSFNVKGGPLRGMPRRRHIENRNELPAGRVRGLRGMPRPALQSRDSRSEVQRQIGRRTC